MVIDDYAKVSKIPAVILKKISSKGLVKVPLSEDDIKCLNFLEKVWEDKAIFHALIHKLLIRKSQKARDAFLNTIDLETKWERYAFSRFFNYDPKDHGGRKLHLSVVVEDLKKYLNFSPDYFQVRRLYKVRKMVYNIRAREKKKKYITINTMI
jgi:hypothetical protein